MSYLALGALIGALGVIGYLAYALVGATKNEHASDAALIAAGKAQIEAERNLRDAESQRDTEKAARDKAEAENAELRAQLVSTQAALAKVSEESATNAADSVRTSSDPLGELDRVLSFSARPDMPEASDPSAGDGHQG